NNRMGSIGGLEGPTQKSPAGPANARYAGRFSRARDNASNPEGREGPRSTRGVLRSGETSGSTAQPQQARGGVGTGWDCCTMRPMSVRKDLRARTCAVPEWTALCALVAATALTAACGGSQPPPETADSAAAEPEEDFASAAEP